MIVWVLLIVLGWVLAKIPGRIVTVCHHTQDMLLSVVSEGVLGLKRPTKSATLGNADMNTGGLNTGERLEMNYRCGAHPAATDMSSASLQRHQESRTAWTGNRTRNENLNKGKTGRDLLVLLVLHSWRFQKISIGDPLLKVQAPKSLSQCKETAKTQQ